MCLLLILSLRTDYLYVIPVCIRLNLSVYICISLPIYRFDQQASLPYFPRVITEPFEIIISIVSTGLSEENRDIMIGLLADACSERLQHFINQVRWLTLVNKLI